MPSFTDSKDRVWIVRVTPYTMQQVRDFCGVNLGTILQDDMRPLQRLVEDPVDVCSVMYAICKDQADERGIELKDFLEGIVGDPIDDVVAALLEGLQQCFPSTRKAAMTALITVTRHNENKTKKRVDKLLTDLIYLDSCSRWRRLWVLIRGIIPGMS